MNCENVPHFNPGQNKNAQVRGSEAAFCCFQLCYQRRLPHHTPAAALLGCRGPIFFYQVVLRLSLSPTPLRTPFSVWIKPGAGLHGWLNTEEHSGPPISQRERLTHNESSSICTSSIIILIVSSSMGMLSVKFSIQHSFFSCFYSIIPTVWQVSTQPHTSVAVQRSSLFPAAQRPSESAYAPWTRG